MTLTPEVRAAAELVVGNLSETGYLTATDEELASALLQYNGPTMPEPIPFERGVKNNVSPIWGERRETTGKRRMRPMRRSERGGGDSGSGR